MFRTTYNPQIFLFVADKVLGSRLHTADLHTPNFLASHDRRQIRVW